MELANRIWKAFEIGKLFTLTAGKSKGLNHLTKDSLQGVNYLGATNSNNGVLAHVQAVKGMVQRGNAICFIRNGEGSMGYSIYKAEDFIATSDISVGYSNFLNRDVGLFITTVADKVRGKYNFGYKRSETRLKKEKILLPVTSTGNPDYAFMESYMKQKETYFLSVYEKQLSLLKPNDVTDAEVEWREFLIGDIFKIYSTSSSIDKIKLNGVEGPFPYITRTDKNNGYDSFVGEQPSHAIDKGNVITIGLDTQTVFYQQSPFYTGQNIQIMEFDELNKYNAQFIIALLKKQMTKFSWGGNGATLTRLKKTRILLPVDSDGRPDYEFMERHIKAMEYKKLKTYIDYKSLKLGK